MAVWLSSELQTSHFWQQVQSLANELLAASPLLQWTITVRPVAAEDARTTVVVNGDEEVAARPWHTSADRMRMELTVGVPLDEADDVEETEPEDAASYLVFDLLDGVVRPDPPAQVDGASTDSFPGTGAAAQWPEVGGALGTFSRVESNVPGRRPPARHRRNGRRPPRRR